MREKKSAVSRRRFCLGVGGALLATACGSPSLFEPGGRNPADLSSALPPITPYDLNGVCTIDGGSSISADPITVGSYAPYNGFFVCHDAAGYYALKAVCTYDAAAVKDNVTIHGFQCTNCQTQFTFGGQAITGTGPATITLVHTLICVTGIHELIVVDIPVDPNTRVTV